MRKTIGIVSAIMMLALMTVFASAATCPANTNVKLAVPGAPAGYYDGSVSFYANGGAYGTTKSVGVLASGLVENVNYKVVIGTSKASVKCVLADQADFLGSISASKALAYCPLFTNTLAEKVWVVKASQVNCVAGTFTGTPALVSTTTI